MATLEELEKRVAALEARSAYLTSPAAATLGMGTGTPQPKEPDPIASTSPAPEVAAASVVAAEPPVEFKRVSELTDEEKEDLQKAKDAQIAHAEAQARGAVPATVEPESERDKAQAQSQSRSSNGEPVAGYDRMTSSETVRWIKTIKTSEQKDRAVEYEKTHRNRPDILAAYGTWVAPS